LAYVQFVIINLFFLENAIDVNLAFLNEKQSPIQIDDEKFSNLNQKFSQKNLKDLSKIFNQGFHLSL